MANKTITVLLKAVSGAYRAEMTKNAAATQALATAGGKASRTTQALQSVLGPTGLAAAKVAAGFAGVGGITFALVGSARAAIQFESDMAGVAKTLEDSRFGAAATEAVIDTLGHSIRRMATEMPASTTEIARVAEAAGQLGIRTSNIAEFTKTMVMMGTATNLQSDVAADALARLANITQMPQHEFDKLGSTVVHLGNRFASTEEEIVNMGMRIAGAGNVIGLTEDEILSFATALTSVGVKAEAGGSAISRTFLTINDAVMSGGAELQAFADVAGMASDKFAQMFKETPAEAVQAVVEGLQRVRLEGGNVNETLRELGLSEIRVRDALLRLAGAGGLLGRALEEGSLAWEANNALVKEAEARYETTASKLEIAKNNLKDFGIEMGNNVLPIIGDAASAFTSFLQRVKGANDETKGFVDQGLNILAKSIGALIPGMGQWAEKQREADIAMRMFEDGTLEAAKGLEAYKIVMQSTHEGTDVARSTIDGYNFALEHQGKQVVPGVNSSMKLMTEHIGQADRATLGLDGTTGELNSQLGIQSGTFSDLADMSEQWVDQLEQLMAANKSTLEGITAWFDPMERYTQLLETKNEKERESAEATAESTKKSGDSWEDYFGETEASFELYIQSLKDQLKAHEEWNENLNKIRKASSDEYADMLTAQGPEFAALHAEIAKQSNAKIKEGADLQLELWQQVGRDVLEELNINGSDWIDETGEISTAVVLAMSNELGIAPDIVRGILEDSNSVARRGMLDLENLVETSSGRVVDKMDAQLGHAKISMDARMREMHPVAQRGMDESGRIMETGARTGVNRMDDRLGQSRVSMGARMQEMHPVAQRGMNETERIMDRGGRQSVAAMARRLGAGTGEVARITNSYARALANGLNPVLRSVGGKVISVARSQLGQAGLSGQNRAEGGIDEPRPNAHITNQMSIIYGEPETGGEAYIPLSPAKRPRSRMIAAETVSRLGGNVEWMAPGGFKGVKDVPKVPAKPFSGDVSEVGVNTMQHAREAAIKWLKENLAPELGAGIGWKKMWAALSRRFPGAALHSAFRPGAITATGNRSYHGMGRAIDVSPWRSIAEWIIKNYFKQTREMIFSPMGGREIHNGGWHNYGGITNAMHYDHVHWAMEQGGIAEMAKGGMRGGRWKPPRGYNAYIKRLMRRIQGGKSLYEDFSFPGMGRFGRKYNDAVAARFYRGHPNFDFGAGGSRNQRSTLLRALRSYLAADGGLLNTKTLAREIGKTMAPMLGAPKDADADHDKLAVPVHSYDQGGMLPTGLSMSYNGTGSPERVTPNGVGAQVMVIVPGLNETFLGQVQQMNVSQARMHTHRARAGA